MKTSTTDTLNMPKLREKISKEVIRIADELISKREKDQYGLACATMSVKGIKDIEWIKQDSIYSGNAGIAIFLLEVYQFTTEKKYLSAVLETLNWLENHLADENTYKSYSQLMTGGPLSLCYLYLKLNLVQPDKNLVEKALKVADNIDVKKIVNGKEMYEYLNGIGGALILLTLLYEQSKEETLLSKIDFLIGQTIDHAIKGPEGFYWDKNERQIKGLCGFSHGAAGIGYTLIELGNYFKNEALIWMGKQAFIYENHFFNEKYNNWPDFRKGIFSEKDYEEHKKEYQENNIDFFTQPGYMNAWCHGAAGIGLARLRAFALTGETKWREDAECAIRKTYETDVLSGYASSFTLCHGKGGNADVFLEGFLSLKEQKYYDMAFTIAEKIIEAKEQNNIYMSGLMYVENKEDYSMYMGNAGIGYFLLRVLNPEKIDSILIPKIDQNNDLSIDEKYFNINISLADLKRKLFNRLFPRTIKVLEKTGELPLINSSIEKQIDFNKIIENSEEKLTSGKESVKAICQLEKRKLDVEASISSLCLIYIRDALLSEGIMNLYQNWETVNEDITLVMYPETQIISVDGIWQRLINEDPDDDIETYSAMLKPTIKGVQEIPLTEFAYQLLEYFKEPITIKAVVSKMLDVFEINTEEEKGQVKEMCKKQIGEMVLAGMLISPF